MNNEIDYTLLEQARVMIFVAYGATVEDSNVESDIWFTKNAQPYYRKYRISPNWLNVPEGYEIVPLGEEVEGHFLKRGIVLDQWVPVENGSTNDNPLYFVARPTAKLRLQIQEGKWYKRRDGKVFQCSPNPKSVTHPWCALGNWYTDHTSPHSFIEEIPKPRRVPLTPDDLRERALSGKPMYYEYGDNGDKYSKLCQSLHSPVTGINLLRKEARWIDGTPCWKEE